MTHYEKMRENYEDAVFYLLMDQLAGKQEEEYNKINEELKNDPTFEVPAEMRKASYRTIKKEFSKAHRATAKRVAWKVFQRVSILIAIVTLLITGAFAISPELRTHVLNLVVETFDGHANIHFSPSQNESDMSALEINWVPDGYACTYKSDDGTMWEFTNKEDHWITLIMLPDSAGIDLDTENASIVEHLCIGDCQGLYIERPDDNSLIWGDASVGGGFALASDNLDKTAIKKIAEKISAK